VTFLQVIFLQESEADVNHSYSSHIRSSTPASRQPSFMRQAPTRGLVGSLYAPGVGRTCAITGM
jgi:hypothetical protein